MEGGREVKIIARAGKMKLQFDPITSRFIMTGGRYGDHKMYAQCFTDRRIGHGQLIGVNKIPY
jgi:hypothetical protein